MNTSAAVPVSAIAGPPVAADPAGGRPVLPRRGSVRPLGLTEVTALGGFWGQRQQVNAAASLAHCERWMERVGWLANFDHVVDGTIGANRTGWVFADSEVYKLLEALCWEAGRTGSTSAAAAITRLTARIAPAQDEDGYLGTAFGHPGQPERYTDLEMGHELYNIGHLLQAAVARLRTYGEDELVRVARRAADHVCDAFGADGRQQICGHPEIELGLTEFGRATGEDSYIEQARLFLDRRGHATLADVPFGRTYFQDDLPIRDADVWRGHAVRALYLAAAAVDVAVERSDDQLLAAIERQWAQSVARRTYLTGGMGSRHQDEGFGDDWELSPDRAYCETCAGVASIMVSWRLFLATGQMRYQDLIERTLYNVVATSPRADGQAFFYANPLHQRVAGATTDDNKVNPRAEGGTRAAWFDVSCCPTNLARTLASLNGYLATTDDDGLQLLQYAPVSIDTTLPDGRRIALAVETDYPRTGTVRIRVIGSEPRPWSLTLRIPSWAGGAALGVGADIRPVQPGPVTITREFARGEEIILRLPMRPRFTWPDGRIDAVRGCVAVERGPRVLCLEGTDLPVGLDEIRIDPSVPPTDDQDTVRVTGRVLAGQEVAWPYQHTAGDAADRGRQTPPTRVEIPLRPYHQWAERGPTTMRVWLPLVDGADGPEGGE
jgi:DUF1680 family protein